MGCSLMWQGSGAEFCADVVATRGFQFVYGSHGGR